MDNIVVQKNRFESFDLILFIFQKRKTLIILTLLGLIVSAVVSLVITPRFRSNVILYPASSSSVSQSLLTSSQQKKDILKFGTEEEVEQLLQILYSDRIREKVVAKFDLLTHYGIDSTSQFRMTELEQEFNDNITFTRTEYQSIRIDVLDRDAQMAADIANHIAALIDSSMNNIQKERAQKALAIVEKEFFTLKAEKKKLEDSLSVIRQLGINDYEKQTQSYNDAYAEAIIKNSPHIKILEEKLKILSTYGGVYVSLRDLLVYQTEKVSHLESRYREALVDAEQTLPNKYIVNQATKAEKKAFPIRWLIVAVSTLATFILTFLMLIIIDAFKQAKLLDSKQ